MINRLANWHARWRAFAGEADRTRAVSRELAARIQARPPADTPETAAVLRLRAPVAGRLTSPFGMRDGRMHDGVDLAAAAGTPVHAAAAGVVVLAGTLGPYGRVVVVGHDRHHATVYAHLSTIDVADGERIDPDNPLGTVGTTGRAFGAHLHFEVRFEGTPVDPLVFVPDLGTSA